MATSGKPSITYALNRALRSVHTGPETAPVVALARRYASALDQDPGQLGRLGPPFLRALAELTLTPAARRGVLGGSLDEEEPGDVTPGEGANDDGSSGRDGLDELRARRDRRANGTASVDSSAP